MTQKRQRASTIASLEPRLQQQQFLQWQGEALGHGNPANEPLQHFVDRLEAIEIALTQLDAATNKMHVRVMKAGQQHLSLEIHDACLRTDPRIHAGV